MYRSAHVAIYSCALAVFALAPSARAQQDTARTRSDSVRADSSDRRSNRTLDPMVVRAARTRGGYAPERSGSAMKSDTPLRDTPQSVSIVTGALIADQSMQSMADVVRYVPGVTMGQGEGHRDAPTIRGNSSTADFFVDGVRDDAQYYRDLYNVERVEALKGSNAMIFGRGGGGGVINRVSKEADWSTRRLLSTEVGSFEHGRATIDLGQPLTSSVAVRFNGMYDRSGSYRDAVSLTRYGLNPTVSILAGRTSLKLGYEYFDDSRVVDRGIPSYHGRPIGDVRTFFGNPDSSRATTSVHAAGATLEHAGEHVVLRNRARYVHYDKYYQNVYPGAVSASGTDVSISAYGNNTVRGNLFNQTDLLFGASTGVVRHAFVVGAEVGQQLTDNLRRTGYFDSTSTTRSVPLAAPTVRDRVTFRQSATDADNHVSASVAAAYVQDQITLSKYLQAVGGVRYERFDLKVHDNRSGSEVARADVMLSPRAGLVIKPDERLSFYGATSISHLPSSGDQFSSLSATTKALEPERFTNYEIGAKWAMRPSLELTTALYRLDRSNSAARDPNDPSKTVQTGAQRTTGYELSLSGSVVRGWDVAGGYSVQRATIVNATNAAKAGATVPLVPRTSMSIWNKVQVAKPVGLGLGVVHQTKMYAAIDDAVTLPGFTRVDVGMFVRLAKDFRLQLNVENLFDDVYYWTSHGNNNIMPGASRTLRLTIGSG